ncbi:MAG: hypothetical protein ACP5NE_02210 [Candidatus Micrarchaeia archaeon]
MHLPSFKEKNRSKDNSRAKDLYNLFEKLASGICIVEGLHDIHALSYVSEILGISISAITYDNFMKNGISGEHGVPVYVFTDEDYGGKLKQASIVNKLNSMGPDVQYDVVTGRRILYLLGVKCVEQVKKPLENAMSGYI